MNIVKLINLVCGEFALLFAEQEPTFGDKVAFKLRVRPWRKAQEGDNLHSATIEQFPISKFVVCR